MSRPVGMASGRRDAVYHQHYRHSAAIDRSVIDNCIDISTKCVGRREIVPIRQNCIATEAIIDSMLTLYY